MRSEETSAERIERAHAAAVRRLLDERGPDGHWIGELSTSALSTATAAIALTRVAQAADRPALRAPARRGLEWLAAHANDDGGFGDTPDSPSNPSTTTLAWVALGMGAEGSQRAAERAAGAWLRERLGSTEPDRLADSLLTAYGADRTFSVPILVVCALSGKLGPGRTAWRRIPALPFELALCPHALFRFLGLPMVSYALPALIAIGIAIHEHRPSRNPLARAARGLGRASALRRLGSIQPATGGFLEATPLTSFVATSLAAAGHARHPVVSRCVDFLVSSARADGSWPIDSNLATWVTTLSVQALARGGRLGDHLGREARSRLASWLLGQQAREVHPYTHAAPGGWAWTDLAGGVPDADDTPGALLALACFERSERIERAAEAGLGWLAAIQNRDGGFPTFCRGWSEQPFDRSSPDLTAHAMRAFAAWGRGNARTVGRAIDYLVRAQRADGAWIPLWFGNQREARLENPTYGTARVLLADESLLPAARTPDWQRAVLRGLAWLRAAQHADGGFGGSASLAPTIEETALGVEALASLAPDRPELLGAVEKGAAWLAAVTREGTHFPPSPIGLYFAKLWYSERLYPIAFTVAALARAAESGSPAATPAAPDALA